MEEDEEVEKVEEDEEVEKVEEDEEVERQRTDNRTPAAALEKSKTWSPGEQSQPTGEHSQPSTTPLSLVRDARNNGNIGHIKVDEEFRNTILSLSNLINEKGAKDFTPEAFTLHRFLKLEEDKPNKDQIIGGAEDIERMYVRDKNETINNVFIVADATTGRIRDANSISKHPLFTNVKHQLNVLYPNEQINDKLLKAAVLGAINDDYTDYVSESSVSPNKEEVGFFHVVEYKLDKLAYAIQKYISSMFVAHQPEIALFTAEFYSYSNGNKSIVIRALIGLFLLNYLKVKGERVSSALHTIFNSAFNGLKTLIQTEEGLRNLVKISIKTFIEGLTDRLTSDAKRADVTAKENRKELVETTIGSIKNLLQKKNVDGVMIVDPDIIDALNKLEETLKDSKDEEQQKPDQTQPKRRCLYDIRTTKGAGPKRITKKHTKKVKSKMLKGKSKKHLKASKKDKVSTKKVKKTDKKVRFHSSSKKSKKTTRKKR